MNPKEIKPEIYSVGAVDWDRRLFDSLIPLPDGTSYNSYLIRGKEKVALIDTVDPTMTGVLMSHLDALGIRSLDYVIANHAEQDHSGSLPQVLARYPEAKVISTPRCKEMLTSHLHLPEDRMVTVNDRETLSLGNKTLEFIHFPWVHWPETMLTYVREDRTLFPCDLFGSHLATSEIYVHDEGRVYEAAKRYYAEIMMPFRLNIQRNYDRLKEYTIDTIAPSHGTIHLKPEFIMGAYHEWLFAEPKNSAVIPYVSMHGSTRTMVAYLAEALSGRGVGVQQFDLTVTDPGKLAISLVDAATVIIGTPTVLGAAHPAAAYAVFLANALRPKLKFATVIGSFGWGGRTVEQLTAMLPNLKVQIIEPVMIKGLPRESDFQALDKLADSIAAGHKELKLT
ncbi:MAG: FprA family A-type flavoprotein [Chloroflexota bacterium]